MCERLKYLLAKCFALLSLQFDMQKCPLPENGILLTLSFIPGIVNVCIRVIFCLYVREIFCLYIRATFCLYIRAIFGLYIRAIFCLYIKGQYFACV